MRRVSRPEPAGDEPSPTAPTAARLTARFVERAVLALIVAGVLARIVRFAFNKPL